MAYVIYGSKEGPGPYVWVPERNLMIPIGSVWKGASSANGTDRELPQTDPSPAKPDKARG